MVRVDETRHDQAAARIHDALVGPRGEVAHLRNHAFPHANCAGKTGVLIGRAGQTMANVHDDEVSHAAPPAVDGSGGGHLVHGLLFGEVEPGLGDLADVRLLHDHLPLLERLPAADRPDRVEDHGWSSLARTSWVSISGGASNTSICC